MSRRISGKAGLSDSILEFFTSNNIRTSKAFADRLGVHVKRYIISQLEQNGSWGLRGLGTLRVRYYILNNTIRQVNIHSSIRSLSLSLSSLL